MSKKENHNSVAQSKRPKGIKPGAAVLQRWQVVIAALGVIAAFLGLILNAYINLSKQVSNVGKNVTDVGNRVENVEKNVLSDKFIITSPREGDSVEGTAVVTGKTPFTERNHYIVVTPIKTNEDFVQDRLIRADSSGSWAGRVVFGTADVGIGQQFLIRVLATTGTVPPGKLIDLPADAIPSQSVVVTRRK